MEWYGGGRGYHFALGQELVRHPIYREVVKQSLQRGGFLIVDNGAAEEDTVSFELIVEAANEVGADEIILPDVLRNADATIKATCTQRYLDWVPPRRRMIVPQGDSWDEWEYCLRTIDHYLRGKYAAIGLPKHLERLPGGRSYALTALIRRAFQHTHHIHLLGIWGDAFREIKVAKDTYSGVRGIDSGLAAAAAHKGLRVIRGGARASLDWEMQITERDMSVIHLTMVNTNTIDAWCSRDITWLP
jgi:hypothetical protein